MTARWLGIRDFPGPGVCVNQGYGSWKVRVEPCAATAVSHLFRLLGRCSLMCAERVKAFENEPTVVAKQFVQPKHAQKEDRIIIITLNPLTVAPGTLHTGPF